MAILNIQIGSVGLVGVSPVVVYIDTNDTLATVTTAGYLTQAKAQGFAFTEDMMACVSTRATPNAATVDVAWLEISISGTTVSLIPTGAPGQVVLPTITNAIVYATNVTGTLSTAGANIFNLGNIAAGQSGTAGTLTSFPATAANGSLIIAAVNNVGGHTSTVSSVAGLGQNTAYTLPDPGVAAAQFILNNNAGTQTIATGSLALTAGNFTAGSSGHAGTLTSFSGTAARGSLIIAAVANTGNSTTTLSNNAMGQATVVNIPDPGNAIGQLLIGATATPFTANHIMVASGTGGLVADAGYQMKVGAQVAVAGGAAAQTVVDAFCTAASNVIANWNDTTNAVEIKTVAAGNGSFVVTSTADPGASHINYIITKV
jgi:hypothetical protein